MWFIHAKNYVKYDGHDVEPVPIFLSGSEETGSIGSILYYSKTY